MKFLLSRCRLGARVRVNAGFVRPEYLGAGECGW